MWCLSRWQTFVSTFLLVLFSLLNIAISSSFSLPLFAFPFMSADFDFILVLILDPFSLFSTRSSSFLSLLFLPLLFYLLFTFLPFSFHPLSSTTFPFLSYRAWKQQSQATFTTATFHRDQPLSRSFFFPSFFSFLFFFHSRDLAWSGLEISFRI